MRNLCSRKIPENNYNELYNVFKYFNDNTILFLSKVSTDREHFKKLNISEFMMSEFFPDITYNLLASIPYFLSSLDSLIVILQLFETGIECKISRAGVDEKVDWLAQKSEVFRDRYIYIKNINKIYRNRFLHNSTIYLHEIGLILPVLNLNVSDTTHSSTLIFYPQEILECLDLFKEIVKIYEYDDKMKYAYAYCKSGIKRYREDDMVTLIRLYKKDKFNDFNKILNWLSGAQDYDNDILQEDYDYESNSGFTSISRITGAIL